jgi:NAD(P)-dependent dehydrogenase (short-subunit alcohol dehydrogenase family)
MPGSAVTIYLITGATRGLGQYPSSYYALHYRVTFPIGAGLSLVDDVASKDPHSVIYAGARDPSDSGASKLKEMAAKHPGRVEVVKYVSGDKEGNELLAKEIGSKYGRVDTIIANAGAWWPSVECTIDAD